MLPGAPGQKGDVENGKKFFLQSCFQCHGLQGQGGAAAPIGAYGARFAPPRIALEAVRAYIRHPGGMMPPYTAKVLSDSEIDDIYAYLKTLPMPRSLKDIPILSY